jgi:DNA repair exonuclease SbcCD nuclease subunit
MGNHDGSRDADRVSAFQIFAGLVRPFGVIVVQEAPVVVGDHVLIPWNPFVSAAEMVAKHADLISEATIAVGHYDIVMGDENRIPAKALLELGIEKIITGHDHLRRELKVGGLPVLVTGSMEPFSHSEDPEGKLYVTITYDEMIAASEEYRDKCVRVRLKHDQVMDYPLDCLQLTIQRETDEGDVDLGEVDFEAFDLHGLFEEARKQVEIDEPFGKLILTKLEEARAERG